MICECRVPKDQITIVIGEHDRNLTEESDTVYRKIGTIIRHPQFNRANFHNDIALLRLDEPLRFTKAVAPACLPIGFGENLHMLFYLCIFNEFYATFDILLQNLKDF